MSDPNDFFEVGDARPVKIVKLNGIEVDFGWLPSRLSRIAGMYRDYNITSGNYKRDHSDESKMTDADLIQSAQKCAMLYESECAEEAMAKRIEMLALFTSSFDSSLDYDYISNMRLRDFNKVYTEFQMMCLRELGMLNDPLEDMERVNRHSRKAQAESDSKNGNVLGKPKKAKP